MPDAPCVPWKELPPPYRKAVQKYGVRGLPRNMRWCYAEIPLGFLVAEVDQSSRAIRPSRAFMRSMNPYPWMRKDPDSKWAIILDGPPGGPYIAGSVIEDGWHRFHWYVSRYGPDEMIPVVWGKH